jgi:hypothetical protein
MVQGVGKTVRDRVVIPDVPIEKQQSRASQEEEQNVKSQGN